MVTGLPLLAPTFRKPRKVGHPAYNVYTDDPFNHSCILPLLAAAHIIVDLELALSDLNCVTKEEYDSVFQDIISCADEVGNRFIVDDTIGKTIFNWSVFFSRPSFGKGAKLLLSLSSIPLFRRFAVRRMREYAWKAAQIRKNLKRL